MIKEAHKWLIGKRVYRNRRLKAETLYLRGWRELGRPLSHVSIESRSPGMLSDRRGRNAGRNFPHAVPAVKAGKRYY